MRAFRWVIPLGMVSGLVLLVSPLTMKSNPKLLYNPSPSAEIGWYRVVPQKAYARGDLVAAYLPEEVQILADGRGYLPRGIPVIKSIEAVAGDVICYGSYGLSLPEQPPLRTVLLDSLDRRMPVRMPGCLVVPVGEVVLISRRIETSFDSRYFGSVPATGILGHAEFLGSSRSFIGGFYRHEGWARGLGAQCKIKGRSAAAGLTPCLHIIFCSAVIRPAALLFGGIASADGVIEQRYFTLMHGHSFQGDA